MASDFTNNKKEDLTDAAKTLMGEAFKKVLSVGVGAAFMTEESIKQYLGDVKLPKEMLQMLLAQANKSKDEITLKVSKELMNILSQIDWAKEATKFAETHKFKITAEIDIVPKKQD